MATPSSKVAPIATDIARARHDTLDRHVLGENTSTMTTPDAPVRNKPSLLWRLPEEIRAKILDIACGDNEVAIRTPLFMARGFGEKNHSTIQLNSLVVSKAFYAEARQAWLRSSMFKVGCPREILHLAYPDGTPRKSIRSNLFSCIPDKILPCLRIWKMPDLTLLCLVAEAKRSEMDIHCITIQHHTFERWGRNQDLPANGCAATGLFARSEDLAEDDMFETLATVPGLRNFHLPFDKCTICLRRKRRCHLVALQMDVELFALRKVLENARCGGQIRALERNIKAKKFKAEFIRKVPGTTDKHEQADEVCMEICGWKGSFLSHDRHHFEC